MPTHREEQQRILNRGLQTHLGGQPMFLLLKKKKSNFKQFTVNDVQVLRINLHVWSSAVSDLILQSGTTAAQTVSSFLSALHFSSFLISWKPKRSQMSG